MVYIAQGIVVPIIFATIIAIVLHPLVTFLRRLGTGRVLGITIAVILAFLVILAFGTLLFSQASRFSESWPIFVDKFIVILHQATTWASGYFSITPESLHQWITKTKVELFDTSGTAIGKTLMSIGSTAAIMLLVPVYIFMLLYYQPLLLEFIRRIFGTGNAQDVNEIITQTKTLVQHYIIGLLAEAVIV